MVTLLDVALIVGAILLLRKAYNIAGKVTGISLLFCIYDIVTGKMPEEKVLLIITSANVTKELDFESVVKEYAGDPSSPWKTAGVDACIEVAQRLYYSGKIKKGWFGATNILKGKWWMNPFLAPFRKRI
jgi:hypothetical protein